MKKIIPWIKRNVKKLWGVPGVLLAFIITISGLVQSGEYVDKYFPSVKIWLDANAITIFTIIVIFMACLLVLLGWYCGKLRNKQKLIDDSDKVNKLVLFISPSSGGGGDFYQEHFSHLVKSAVRAANARLSIHITLVCPHKDFGNEDPELLLDVAKNYPSKIAGIFMIPAHPDKEANRNGIIKFKNKYPALVLLDVFPAIDPDKLPRPISFVGGNENEGGALAALLAKQWLAKINKEGTCRVLILKGRSTLWEMQRINSFKDSLKVASDNQKYSSDIYFEESIDLHYELKKASKEIESRITKGQNLSNFDLIFACNDEMAIGALEVIQNLVLLKGVAPASLPKIIGYDGTPEMKRLIKSNNPFLLGTVDVDIEEQAERAINAMTLLFNDPDSRQSELNLLQPTLFINYSLLT